MALELTRQEQQAIRPWFAGRLSYAKCVSAELETLVAKLESEVEALLLDEAETQMVAKFVTSRLAYPKTFRRTRGASLPNWSQTYPGILNGIHFRLNGEDHPNWLDVQKHLSSQ